MTPYLSTNFLRLSSFYCESVFYKGKSNHVKSMLTRNILDSSACTGTTKEKRKPNNKSLLFLIFFFRCCCCFINSAPGMCKGNCTGTHVYKKIGSAWLLHKAGGTSPLLWTRILQPSHVKTDKTRVVIKITFPNPNFHMGKISERDMHMGLVYVAIIVLSLLEQIAASCYNKNELTIKHTVPELHLFLQHLDNLRNKIIIKKFCWMLQLHLGHLRLKLLKFK